MKCRSVSSLIVLTTLSCILWKNEVFGFSVSQTSQATTAGTSRRNFLTAAVLTAIIPLEEANASPTSDNLTADLKVAREKLTPIPDLLDKADWDAVRTILKTPPVNQLWNLGEVSTQ